MTRAQWLDGLVVRAQSGFFTVALHDGRLLVCHLRGRLKKGRREGDLAAIGDAVQVSALTEETGMIESVAPRQRALIRLDPTPRGVYQQVIVANPDQAVFVFACANPAPRLGMLDRFLVIAERQGIPVLIVANKADLLGAEGAEAIFGVYPPLGYPVIYTSVVTNLGMEQLRTQLTGKLSVLAGPSGVGKSSLLNTLQTDLGLQVRSVSLATQKGRHTTVVRQLFPLEGGGYVADTPGLKALALWDVMPEELDGYFPELRERVHLCLYNDCTHLPHEEGCAVRAAVQAGEIAPSRYRSYVNLRTGDEND
ncbi:MAG: ribosome small subunit-dependent GTPase A [Anaerolineales bacterium]